MASVEFKMGAGKSSAIQTSGALETACAEIVKSHTDECDDGPKVWLTDLTSHGCQSGMVGELIYYTETREFFEAHKEEINTLLADMLDSVGVKSPAELFGDKWDAEDPLCLCDQNQNLLAWFAFEETARTIASKLEIEI